MGDRVERMRKDPHGSCVGDLYGCSRGSGRQRHMARERGHMRTWHVCSQHGQSRALLWKVGLSCSYTVVTLAGRGSVSRHTAPASPAASTSQPFEAAFDEGVACSPGRVIREGVY